MGSIIVNNALQNLPKEKRDRIIVVTVGTAKVTPEELCYQSHPYASKLDFVHYGQDAHAHFLASFGSEEERANILKDLSEAKNKLFLLEPHPGAVGLDHDCESPTNRLVFESHIRTYLQNKGEYK